MIGTTPAVSFVEPIGADNEHHGTSTVQRGQEHLVNLVRAIQASPYWEHTAIIITYDDPLYGEFVLGNAYAFAVPTCATGV